MLLKITYTVQEDPNVPCKITATCPVLGQSDDQHKKCWWVLIEGKVCPLILAVSDPSKFVLEIGGKGNACVPVESVEVAQDFVSPLTCLAPQPLDTAKLKADLSALAKVSGLSKDELRSIAKANNLPESSANFTPSQYSEMIDILVQGIEVGFMF